MLKMTDVDLRQKRVLLREDFNVPLENGRISNDKRIRAALPSIQTALQQNAAVILLSHLGRPTEGKHEQQYSLAPVAERLALLLHRPVHLQQDYLQGVAVQPGEIVLCENVRFNKGEKANDEGLAKLLAALCDVFVMDAFSVAHRSQASTVGVAQYAAFACAGPLLIAEVEALQQALQNPSHPIVAIVGGSKVSTKLTVLKQLVTLVDHLILGGGIANTFIAAKGNHVGKSLYEPDFIPQAKQLLKTAAIPLPSDVVVATKLSKSAKAEVKAIDAVSNTEMILDIGPQTIAQYSAIIAQAGTVVWNGPVGVFEYEQFAAGTTAIAKAIARCNAYTIAGGGDTIAAIDKYAIADKLSYISTGGGAFLEFLEGKKLPAIAALEQKIM